MSAKAEAAPRSRAARNPALRSSPGGPPRLQWLLLAGLLAAVPAAAPGQPSDPITPIVDTGQSRCYNNSTEITCPVAGQSFYGQDAQYSRHAPSCVDNLNGTVTDLITGLMWQKSPDMDGNGIINYSDKMYFDDALAGAASFSLAGYSDWRLPTITELYSLIMFYGAEPNPNATSCPSCIPFIDTSYFDFAYGDLSAGERIIDAQYASATLYIDTTMGGNRTMFGVNFADGRIKGYPADVSIGKRYYVLYVRGGTTYGTHAYVDNSNGTVTDGATGLMWMKGDNGGGILWEVALSYAEDSEYAGYTDWRLPSAKDLQDLVDYTRSPGTTGSAAIDAVFNCTSTTNEAGASDYPCYWSSTTFSSQTPTNGTWAAYVSFGRAMGYMPQYGGWIDVHGAGAQRSDPKTGDPAMYPQGHGPQGDAVRIYNYVRLVRDAESAVGAGEDGSPPIGAGLMLRALPNPASGSVAIRFALPVAGAARVAAHDASGRLVRVLTFGVFSAGEHEVAWSGTDASGRRLPTGVYFVRVETARETAKLKITLVQ